VTDFEMLLREAFQPLEPPEDLEARLEDRLTSLALSAIDDLEGWEIASMRDPRNWIPTATAAGVGGAAAIGLVLVRTQRRRHKRRAISDNALELVENTLRDLAKEAGKVVDQGRRRL
jgi:hypothetical protein